MTAAGALVASLVFDRVPKLPPATLYRQPAKPVNFSSALRGSSRIMMLTHDEITIEVDLERAREVLQQMREGLRYISFSGDYVASLRALFDKERA